MNYQKFTPKQHENIANRYMAKVNQFNSKEENEKWERLATMHIEFYIQKTGQLPE